MADPAEYRRHLNAGSILITIALAFVGLGILCLTLSAYQWSIPVAIVAMVIGSSAFKHFEKAAVFKPRAPIIHELQLFVSGLKSGGEVNVHLQILYPSEQDSPYALERIKVQLQRALNIHLSTIEALSTDPYTEIDSLLKKEIEPLRQELGLGKIALQTISVKTSGASKTSVNAIRLKQ